MPFCHFSKLWISIWVNLAIRIYTKSPKSKLDASKIDKMAVIADFKFKKSDFTSNPSVRKMVKFSFSHSDLAVIILLKIFFFWEVLFFLKKGLFRVPYRLRTLSSNDNLLSHDDSVDYTPSLRVCLEDTFKSVEKRGFERSKCL